MKTPYQIKREEYTYTYRSYMACEDQGPNDCVGTRSTWVVYRGSRQLKSFCDHHRAVQYIKGLNKKRREALEKK